MFTQDCNCVIKPEQSLSGFQLHAPELFHIIILRQST